jgi:hypothetical protein
LPFEKLLLLGLGPHTSFDEEAARRATERLVRTLEGLQVKRPVVELPGRADGTRAPRAAADLVLSMVAAAHDAWWLVEDADGEKAISRRAEEGPRSRAK